MIDIGTTITVGWIIMMGVVALLSVGLMAS